MIIGNLNTAAHRVDVLVVYQLTFPNNRGAIVRARSYYKQTPLRTDPNLPAVGLSVPQKNGILEEKSPSIDPKDLSGVYR